MEAHQGPLSPLMAAHPSQEPHRRTATPAAEVSPGDGAFSPPNDDHIHQRHDEQNNSAHDDDSYPVGFGPPPAFPSSNKSHKRKRTLIVSASVNGSAPFGEGSSEDDDESDPIVGINKMNKQSQMIHRIQKVGDTHHDARSPDMEADVDGSKKNYNDAMLLASMSDVESPKKPEEFDEDHRTTAPPTTTAATHLHVGTALLEQRRSPTSSETSSTAHTPTRSNLNPNAMRLGSVTPYALMPKPVPDVYHSNKQGKFAPNAVTPSHNRGTAPPQSPDGRDPKAAKPMNEKAAREGVYNAPNNYPQHPAQGSGSQYPPGAFHPGYPYQHPNPHAAHNPHHSATGHPAYPPGYPYHMSYGYPQGPPRSSPYYPGYPAPYYPHGHPSQVPSHPQAHTQAVHAPYPTASSSRKASSPERWGEYHSRSHRGAPEAKPTRTAPEPVHSNTNGQYPPSCGASNTSRVVPRVLSNEDDAEGVYGCPPPPVNYGAAPQAGYPEPRYGGSPPSREGYYPTDARSAEYNAISISRDDGSPPRTSSSSHHSGTSHPGESHPEYSPVSSPPRSHYDYYRDQGQAQAHVCPPGSLPGLHHGASPSSYPPHPRAGAYHPYSPPTPGYVHPPQSGGVMPSPSVPHSDPYEPIHYATGSSPEAHYHVPATVSNETESVAPHHPPVLPQLASPPSSSAGTSKYHQFRKGGRSIHSKPITLRKKFSWRNYPELEEYLIANRPDYLRHSALNYTAEQKHFNNRLTEGLLEMAAKLNYLFDETCFNFVSVRDRIRCYYKSYVQSSKKRGVVVGFNGIGLKKEGDGCMGEA